MHEIGEAVLLRHMVGLFLVRELMQFAGFFSQYSSKSGEIDNISLRDRCGFRYKLFDLFTNPALSIKLASFLQN